MFLVLSNIAASDERACKVSPMTREEKGARMVRESRCELSVSLSDIDF